MYRYAHLVFFAPTRQARAARPGMSLMALA